MSLPDLIYVTPAELAGKLRLNGCMQERAGWRSCTHAAEQSSLSHSLTSGEAAVRVRGPEAAGDGVLAAWASKPHGTSVDWDGVWRGGDEGWLVACPSAREVKAAGATERAPAGIPTLPLPSVEGVSCCGSSCMCPTAAFVLLLSNRADCQATELTARTYMIHARPGTHSLTCPVCAWLQMFMRPYLL